MARKVQPIEHVIAFFRSATDEDVEKTIAMIRAIRKPLSAPREARTRRSKPEAETVKEALASR